MFAGRDEERANKAIAQIVKERGSVKCSFLEVDLASFTSVLQFCKRLCVLFPKLDYVALCAGVYGHPYQLTEDGLEYIIQVNYVSNFYLMRQLFKAQAFEFPILR